MVAVQLRLIDRADREGLSIALSIIVIDLIKNSVLDCLAIHRVSGSLLCFFIYANCYTEESKQIWIQC